MSISISGLLSAASLAVAESSSNTAAAQSAQQTTKGSGDTVKLSQSQQVYQLYNQGQRVPQIASSLSLSVEAVNNYLGITGNGS